MSGGTLSLDCAGGVPTVGRDWLEQVVSPHSRWGDGGHQGALPAAAAEAVDEGGEEGIENFFFIGGSTQRAAPAEPNN
jgi:hypothetical protein